MISAKKYLRMMFFATAFFSAVTGFAGEMVFQADFTNAKNNLWPECRSKNNNAKLSLYTEDRTWNQCGKMEILKRFANHLLRKRLEKLCSARSHEKALLLLH